MTEDQDMQQDEGLEITARLETREFADRNLGELVGYRLIDQNGDIYDMEEGANAVGRLKWANNVIIKDKFCSAVHAEIMLEELTLTLTDLGSTNGTYINGIRLAPAAHHPLVPGDEIVIGHTKLRVEAIRDDKC